MQLVVALSHVDYVAIHSVFACSSCIDESLSLSLALFSVEVNHGIGIPKDFRQGINRLGVVLVSIPIPRNEILDFDLILGHLFVTLQTFLCPGYIFGRLDHKSNYSTLDPICQ